MAAAGDQHDRLARKVPTPMSTNITFFSPTFLQLAASVTGSPNSKYTLPTPNLEREPSTTKSHPYFPVHRSCFQQISTQQRNSPLISALIIMSGILLCITLSLSNTGGGSPVLQCPFSLLKSHDPSTTFLIFACHITIHVPCFGSPGRHVHRAFACRQPPQLNKVVGFEVKHASIG
jgi:hypothetical protein